MLEPQRHLFGAGPEGPFLRLGSLRQGSGGGKSGTMSSENDRFAPATLNGKRLVERLTGGFGAGTVCRLGKAPLLELFYNEIKYLY